MRRTSYAGETNNSLRIERFGTSSTSEPKLYRRQTLIRNKNRVSYADNCKVDGEEAEFRPSNKRLRKMKAQSKKTFKFRKNRRREPDEQSPEKENTDLTTSSARESCTTSTTSTNTVTTMTSSTSKSSGLKPVSLTATVIRRAKQRKKSAHKASVEIFIDDDSISSTRTSSTVGYRDSFGENDDGCFHLLERYDDSTAVMRLLQSRQRAAAGAAGPGENILMEEAVTPIAELDTEQEEEEEDTEMNNFVIFEHQDENTLI